MKTSKEITLREYISIKDINPFTKSKIIRAVQQTTYKGVSCKVVGYNFALNTTPERLCDYLIKLETQRAKVREDEPKIIDLD